MIPYLAKGRVGLACGHVASCLAKQRPAKLPCSACLDGHPTDEDLIEAAIADATPEQLSRYLTAIQGRRTA